MNLVARINGKVYEIEQGVTFAEEFNETLDSGVITTYELQEKIADMLPHDDVLIYSVDGKNDDGEYYYTISNQNYTFKGYPFSTANPKPKFYRHLLVDQFTEDVVNIDDSIFKYKIELMSETKKLETIQCSTISITQPLSTEKVDIFTLIKRYVDMFSPVYKEAGENNTWHFKQRYSIDGTSLEPIFKGFYAKDFTETNGSLKDLLSKLFIMRDCIPYVKDDVIYAMEITKRGEKFRAESSEINRITGSRTSSNYADNLRRVYSDALSSEGTTRSVEYVGFRNSDNALVTLNNMRLELGMPIYRINKIYACYYKKAKLNYNFRDNQEFSANGSYSAGSVVYYEGIHYMATSSIGTSTDYPGSEGSKWENIESGSGDYWYLCQQDITPLVKLNTERNVLSQDWLDLTEVDSPKSIEEMAKFKFCTVGYNIGSNYITGWGERYTYPNKFYDTEYTVAENIISKVDYFTPFGDSSSFDEILIHPQYTATIVNTQDVDSNTAIYKNNTEDKKTQSKIFLDNLVTPFSNTSLNLKGVFFIVDYQGFYNGTLTHSKDNERDDVTINDNASSPLTLLEADGVFQKSKANRFGNKSVQINARYDSFYDENDNENVQPLGSVYENDKYEDDIIIYHREYAIYDNFVLATYYGTKSYVLKNYYTSVSARYRTWDIMPYNESVKRVENRKKIFLLSKDTAYYEAPSDDDILKNFGEDKFEKIFSFFKSIIQVSQIKGILNIEKPDQLNYGYIEIYDENGNVTKRVGSDINVFSSGNSLCVNLKMWDNFAQGVQINPNKYESAIGALKYTKEALVGDKNVLVATLNNIKETISLESFKTWDRANFNEAELYSGSQQQWIKLTDDLGKAKTLGFFVGHKDMSEYSTTSDEWLTRNAIINKYKTNLFYLPELKTNSNLTNVIGNKFDLYKENKDCVDMTYQLEVISKDENVFVSDWLLKLSDLLANKNKFGVEVKIDGKVNYLPLLTGLAHSFALGTRSQTETAYAHLIPVMTVAIDKNVSGNISTNEKNPSKLTQFVVYFASNITPNPGAGGRPDRIIFKNFIAQYAYLGENGDNLYLIGILNYYRGETSSADVFSSYAQNYIFKLGKAKRGTSSDYNMADFFSEDYTNKYNLYCNVSVDIHTYDAEKDKKGNLLYRNYDLLESNSAFNGSGTWLSALSADNDNATCKYTIGAPFIDKQYNFPKISDSSGEITLPLVHSYNGTIDGFNFCAFGNLNNFSYDQSKVDSAYTLHNFLTSDIITYRQIVGKKGYVIEFDTTMYVDKSNIIYSIVGKQKNVVVSVYSGNVNRLYKQNLFIINEPTYINKRTFIEEKLYTDINLYLSSKIDNNISIQSQNGKQWIEIPTSMFGNRVGSIQMWYVDDGERYKPSYTLTDKNGEKKQEWNGISYENSIPVYTHFVFGVNLLENDVMPLREFTFVDNLFFTDEQSNFILNMPFESNGEQFNQFKIRKDDNKYLMYYDDKLVSTTTIRYSTFGSTEWNVNANYKTIKTKGINFLTEESNYLYLYYGFKDGERIVDYTRCIRCNIIANKKWSIDAYNLLWRYRNSTLNLKFKAYVKEEEQIIFKNFNGIYSISDDESWKFYFVDDEYKEYLAGEVNQETKEIRYYLAENTNYGIQIQESTMRLELDAFYNNICVWQTIFNNLDSVYPIKIYISSLSKKDTRVFDEYHQVVGKIKNIATENDASNAKNLYTPNENK